MTFCLYSDTCLRTMQFEGSTAHIYTTFISTLNSKFLYNYHLLSIYWRRLFRVPWTARSNQSTLKEISPEYSLEGLMLKLKLQYLATWCEELTHWKRLCCWERLKAGGEGDDREWDGWIASPPWWTWVWASSGSCYNTRKAGVLQSMGLQRVRDNWATELNWVKNLLKSIQVGVPHCPPATVISL